MSIEEVRALVAERQRYDDWLAALDAKRADTPPRVFERVQGDYRERRAGVIGKLQEHVGALSETQRGLEERLGDLERRLAGHEEELAEGMLRNLVGEYDHERWESVRSEIEARISTLGGEREALSAELDDVRALLASARVTPLSSAVVTPEPVVEPAAAVPTPVVASAVTPPYTPPVEPSAFVATPVVHLVVEPTPVVAQPTQIAAGESVTVMLDATPLVVPVVEVGTEEEQGSGSGDLLDVDVSALVENPVPQGPSHEEVLADVAALFNTSSIAAVPEQPGDATNEPDDTMAMFGEVSGVADQQFVQSLQGIEAEHEPRIERVAERSVATATPPAAPNASPNGAPGANDPFDDLAFLRSVIDPGGALDSVLPPPPPLPTPSPSSSMPPVSAEPLKTLRCTECGTMNLPTEWYCERCGGELAAF